MTGSKELATLATVQRLREEHCRIKLSNAQHNHEKKAREQARLVSIRNAAESFLNEVLSADTFCRDRMLLAVGQLAEAERTLAAGQDDLARAREHESAVHREWRETDIKTEILSERAKIAQRRENRRAEDALTAERLSLRAALPKGQTR